MTASLSAADEADLLAAARALLGDERDVIACAANLTALLFTRLPRVNWVGFYFLRDGELVLGPFQGQPACTRIAVGRGVCGTAWARNETLVVPDVHDFPGHIVCDTASASEIVVPFSRPGIAEGVLDIDSPDRDRFTEADRVLIKAAAAIFVEACAPATAA